MTGPAEVFVSYKSEDRARLKPLVAALEAEGFPVWWDARIGGGSNWRQDIEQHLESAACVIVVWTKRSVGPDGEFVRDEAARARRRGVYLPIRLDEVDPPLGFGEVQLLSLKAWKGNPADPNFRALVDAVRSCQSGKWAAPTGTASKSPAISRRVLIAGGAGTVAVAGVGAWALLTPWGSAVSNRVAVMSFANLSGDPSQAYFSDGIAEELRGALSRVGLEVIGRASCDAVKDLAIPEAAAKLGVANILTGSVRRSSQTIRVDAQLVNGADVVEKWAQTYDRAPGDTIRIQTDIATEVASALRVALGAAKKVAIALGGTANAEAQDLILQCRKLSREMTSADSFQRRIALADAAIRLDPHYADAYIARASAFTTMAILFSDPTKVDSQLSEGEAAARKAIAIAPALGGPHSVLAFNAQGRLNFGAALRETKMSLALAPNDTGVLNSASRNLALFGTPAEAFEVADRSRALDPLNAALYSYKAEMLFYLRHYPQAIDAAKSSLRLAPTRLISHLFIGDAFLQLGKPAQAKAEYGLMGADNPLRGPRLALLAARTGDQSGAEQLATQLKQRADVTLNYQLAEIFAQLGDQDRAFAELAEAVRARDSGLAYLRVDPFLDPVRGDPRFAALLKQLNFTA
ncbi:MULTISPECIES: TIR domain-containing protein [Sphingomonas]|uniref:TIR domain-containing protein n=1 Tax=Sphingomonas TaxID=13687 RepID=UPI000DEFC0D0|nr:MULTISPECIES: TIR domain-containing protein [Sphingomonas]